MKMKAVVLAGPNQFETKMIDKPVIDADEILLKMQKAAICGTDIRILEGKKTKDVRYPSVIGHEMCGIIEELGANVVGYQVGDRIAIANVIPCGNCSSCLNGRENACLNRTAIGYQYDGGFAEYVRIPKTCIQAGNVVKIPESVSFTAGALIEPLACCIRGLKNVGTGFNDTVLVVGAGPIGLMHIQLSKISGASKVIVSEPNAFRREKAEVLGADVIVDPISENLEEIIMKETNGLGVGRIILAIGVPAIVNSTIKLCKKGGTVCLFAGFQGTGESSIEANVIHYNEINLCGSTAYKRSDYLAAAEMVKTGKINLDEIATDTYKLDDFIDAYKMTKSGEGLKIVIEP